MPTSQSGIGVSGFLTLVGLAKEATYGTAVAPTTWLPVTDVTGFEGTNKLITAQGIRQSVGNPAPGAGDFEVKPSFGLEVDPDNIGLLLGLAMGTDTVSTAAGVSTHTFSLNNTFVAGQGRLSSATLQVDPQIGTTYQNLGCKLSQLDFDCKMGQFLMAKAMLEGKTVATGASLTSPVFSTARPFEWAHLSGASSCTLNGVNVNLNDFQLSIKNNLIPHYGSQGGRFVTSMDEGLFNVTGSFSVNLVDTSVDQILWGGAAPTAGYIPTVALNMTFTHTQNITGSTPYSIAFNLPAITLSDAPKQIKRGNVVTLQAKFVASESAAGSHNDIGVVLKNGNAVAYV